MAVYRILTVKGSTSGASTQRDTLTGRVPRDIVVDTDRLRRRALTYSPSRRVGKCSLT